MTVAELIVKLQALPQDLEVYGLDGDGRADLCGDPSIGFLRQESDFIQGPATEDDLRELGFDEETIKEAGDSLVEYVVGIHAEW